MCVCEQVKILESRQPFVQEGRGAGRRGRTQSRVERTTRPLRRRTGGGGPAKTAHPWESPTRCRSCALLLAISWRVRASICVTRMRTRVCVGWVVKGLMALAGVSQARRSSTAQRSAHAQASRRAPLPPSPPGLVDPGKSFVPAGSPSHSWSRRAPPLASRPRSAAAAARPPPRAFRV